MKGLDSLYLAKIEAYFSQKRGQGLILSPKDWDLAQKWHQEGIPLPVVLRGIDHTFKQADSGKRIRSLAYCEAEVRRRWQEYKQQMAGASWADSVQDSSLSPLPHILELERCLQASIRQSHPPALLEGLKQIHLRLKELSSREPGDNWEAVLQSIARSLIEILEQAVSQQVLRAFRAQAAKCLQGYESKMSPTAYQQTMERLIKEQLLKKYKLSEFSLYLG